MYKSISTFNPYIFRGYDIRGIMGTDLSDDIYYTLGRSYATYLSLHRINLAAVGRDNRLNGENYSKAFIQGMNDGGINTFDLGLSLSQIVYFSSYEFKTKGGAMLTASHNSSEFNGLKLSTSYSETMVTEEIQQIRQVAESGEFSIGEGKNESYDIFPAYQKDLLRYFNIKKRWKVVIDGCNNTSGLFYPRILRAAGCKVIEKNTNLDSTFPLGMPDPTDIKVAERLARETKEEGADIGFSYDADGDRIGVASEKGEIVWVDTVVALFAKSALKTFPGAPIVFNTLCSRRVSETVQHAGGQPVMWLTGHSFIKVKVRETRAPFGGELSGHMFFADNFYGYDDGAYASLFLLQYLEEENKTLSEAVSLLPAYVTSPEIKLFVADEIKFQLVGNKINREFHRRWSTAEFTEIDGVRFDLGDRMAIIRASQNGPYITVRFEGKTSEIYETLKNELKEILKKYPEIDWTVGTNIGSLN